MQIFARLASVGRVSRSRLLLLLLRRRRRRLCEVEPSSPDAGCRLTGRRRDAAGAQSCVRDRSSPGICFHARCTVFSGPPSIHVTSAAPARIRLSSATVGDRGERSVTVPAAWSADAARLCSVGLRPVDR